MTISDDRWFEVWYVPGVDVMPAYLVVVSPNLQSKEMIVTDISKNEVLFKGTSYEDVFDWLTEDEFELVSGRQFVDDGW